jgi:hypothetical protein
VRLHELYDEIYEKLPMDSGMKTKDDSLLHLRLKNASEYVRSSMIRRKQNITPMDVKPVIKPGDHEAPIQSTWSLYCNQIFIEIQSWNKRGPESIVFHVFDVANDMNRRK